jgi:hypothetical protein
MTPGTAERFLRDATHWDEVVIQLGYEHLRRHDLRHAGLTWMADAGVPLHVLRKIAGHGSLSTTQRYLHPDHRSVGQAGAAVNAHRPLILPGYRKKPADLEIHSPSAGLLFAVGTAGFEPTTP